MDLSTSYMGLPLRNPVVVSSCGLTNSVDGVRACADAGAGAVVLQASDEPGLISTHMHADGQYEDLLQVPQGVSNGYDVTRAGEAFIQMNGNAVFRRAVATLEAFGRRAGLRE